nr:hypothetical protein CFP56_28751 [Quercus suber]
MRCQLQCAEKYQVAKEDKKLAIDKRWLNFLRIPSVIQDMELVWLLAVALVRFSRSASRSSTCRGLNRMEAAKGRRRL